jgi:hypothetical protein
MSTLPTDAAERKAVPLAEGLLFYFPNALAEVARVSKRGNDQHNPGQPMHWAMEKSTDHADCILRHLVDAGTLDTDGMRHTAKVAWRALALLETELLAAGAMPGRNAVRIPPPSEYDPDSVAFRHSDFGKVCGIPNSGRSVPNLVHRTAHPMAAEALRDQDATTPGCAPWKLP